MDLQTYIQEKDHFLKNCGAVLSLCEPGRAEVCLELEPWHRTDVGRPHAHAGLLYSLAETASAAAVLAYGWNGYAVEGNITYFDAVKEGQLRAVARAKDLHGAENGSCRVSIYGPGDQLIAKASFSILYTGEPFVLA